MSRVPPEFRPRTPNGSNGYYSRSRAEQGSDGYGGYGGLGGSGGSGGGSGGAGGRREPRTGGYGGFGDAAAPPQGDYGRSARTHDMQPPEGSGRRRPEKGDNEYNDSSRTWDHTDRTRYNGITGTGSMKPGDGKAGKQIEGVLLRIQDEWDFMTKDDCVPVQVALLLMDSSTIGKADRYPEFQQTNKQLQKALRAIVNEHHQGFNSSIGTFHKIQSSIQSSQNRVRILKESLMQAKVNLLTTKPELKGLSTSSQNYDDMLAILNKIAQLQAVPEQLDARISEKRFVTAVEILQDALELIKKPELENIGALSDLRLYFSTQESSLTEILIEELHDHLYLKSPYCQDRWKPAGQGFKKSEEEVKSLESWEKPVDMFLRELDTSTPMVEDASRNPEADSFYYIQVIIESLHRMGRLEVAVDRIEQRLPVELFAVVDKTNKEVDSRHPSHTRQVTKTEKGVPVSDGEDAAGPGNVLSDLLWTLYSKFEAIAESHRVLHDVIAGIVKRDGLQDGSALTGGFKELWKLYQSEMRSLLHDYLATDGDTSFRSGQAAIEGGNIFRQNQRDKNKKLFKISEVYQKEDGLTAEQEELNDLLKSSVPGLVSSKSRNKPGIGSGIDPHDYDNSGTGHKLLVQPSVFNMSLLLPPSLSFIRRLKELVPYDSDIAKSTLTSFLDDFLINVFHPQLEEAVSDLCAQSFIELDAYQQDSQWSKHALKPIFKGSITFVSIITAFCKMLNSIPQDEVFTQLIITQMATYYDKCFGWYKSLVTRADSRSPGGVKPKAAASFAETGELHDIVAKLLTATSAEGISSLLAQENKLLISKTNETPLEPYDIISDPKSVISLSLLHNSMQWLTSRLSSLRRVEPSQVPPKDNSPTSPTNPIPHPRRWTYLTPERPYNPLSPPPATNKPNTLAFLPLTTETLPAFDGILLSITNLSLLAISTLHLDLRCGIIHMLRQALSTPYTPATPAQQPIAPIRDLVRDLVSFDENVAPVLRKSDRNFLRRGLGKLADDYIVASAKSIPRMNMLGCDLMQLNLLVLQQNLKNVEASPTSSSSSSVYATATSLPRSMAYFSLFALGPEEIVKRAKEGGKAGVCGFGLEEMKALVELAWSEVGKEQGERGKRRGLGSLLLGLSEGLWDS